MVRAAPIHWAQHGKRIAWFGGDEVLLWPVCVPAEHSSYVGKIGATQTEMLNIGYPVDIFYDRDFLVCTASEENFVADVDIQDQSDLISAFSYPGIVRVARFIEPFMEKFSHTRFLEVEDGVLDGELGVFWFTAYDTEYLWCFSLKTHQVSVCQLGCPLRDVLAVSSNGEEVAIILRRLDGLVLRSYTNSGTDLVFNSESELSLADEVRSHLWEAISDRAAYIRGFAGNMIAATTAKRAILAKF